MSKAIRSYPKDEQASVVARRLTENTKGMGYWAAVTYPGKQQEKETPPKKTKTGA